MPLHVILAYIEAEIKCKTLDTVTFQIYYIDEYMNKYSYERSHYTMNDKVRDRCSCTIIHNETVDRVAGQMIGQENAEELADFFKVFGDATRLKILYALNLEEMCVCDLSALLGMTQSAISHQLKVLRVARVVKMRKEGKVVYYSMDDEHIRRIYDQGLSHISHPDLRIMTKEMTSNEPVKK
jgi:ArsR family transcriptional regulator, lead/cadmium/zinc/bismuth-responsive transcriptional repressor